jgi:hypothetical protein
MQSLYYRFIIDFRSRRNPLCNQLTIISQSPSNRLAFALLYLCHHLSDHLTTTLYAIPNHLAIAIETPCIRFVISLPSPQRSPYNHPTTTSHSLQNRRKRRHYRLRIALHALCHLFINRLATTLYSIPNHLAIAIESRRIRFVIALPPIHQSPRNHSVFDSQSSRNRHRIALHSLCYRFAIISTITSQPLCNRNRLAFAL